jgi:hypothetical protein
LSVVVTKITFKINEIPENVGFKILENLDLLLKVILDTPCTEIDHF